MDAEVRRHPLREVKRGKDALEIMDSETRIMSVDDVVVGL